MRRHTSLALIAVLALVIIPVSVWSARHQTRTNPLAGSPISIPITLPISSPNTDLDNDGDSDFIDLYQIIVTFNIDSVFQYTDIQHDHSINIYDYNLLLSRSLFP